MIVAKERKRIKALTLANVDNMTGIEFEYYVGELLKFQGYHISFTKTSGDFGSDIVAQKDNRRISIQLKRYGKPVSLAAVQEAVASKTYYRCSHAMVITNRSYTKAAKILAQSNECTLIDRKELADWIIAFQAKK
jgi:restriction system protein